MKRDYEYMLKKANLLLYSVFSRGNYTADPKAVALSILSYYCVVSNNEYNRLYSEI
jgi:hypothetical protein